MVAGGLLGPRKKVCDFHTSFFVKEDILRSDVTDSGCVSCFHLHLGIEKAEQEEPELSFIESFFLSSAVFDLFLKQIRVVIIADLE